MAVLPSPRTWTSGDTPTAPQFNADLRDGLGFLLNPPRCILFNSTAISLTSNSYILANWDSEVIDTDGMHDPANSPSRMTFVTAGVYDLTAHIRWQPATDGKVRYIILALNNNGTALNMASTSTARIAARDEQLPVAAGAPQVLHLRARRYFAAGDYVEASIGSTASPTVSTQAGPETRFAAIWRSAL